MNAFRGFMMIVITSIVGTQPLDKLLAQETVLQTHVVTVERIWNRAAHSAFTDIIRFEDDLYCTFREGSGHIPGRNGLIRVIRSHDGMNWESVRCSMKNMSTCEIPS